MPTTSLAMSTGTGCNGWRRANASSRCTRILARSADFAAPAISRCSRSPPRPLRCKQVESADDGREEIVEVVRHAAGELAHRLHLLALAERVLRLLALGDGGFDPGLERRVELPQRLFGFLARGDLDRGAGDAKAPARRIEHAAPLRRDPSHDAVFLADGAVLDVVERARRRVGRRREGRGRGLAVVRMQAVVEVLHRDRHVGRDAEHRLGARRPDQGVVDQVDVPEADFGVVDGETQPLLALAQARLGADALDMRPAALDDLLDEADLVRGPVPRPVLMNGHHRGEPTVLDQRAADDRVDADRMEHLAAFAGREFRRRHRAGRACGRHAQVRRGRGPNRSRL